MQERSEKREDGKEKWVFWYLGSYVLYWKAFIRKKVILY